MLARFEWVGFGLIEFGLVWSFNRQTNKLNNYLILIKKAIAYNEDVFTNWRLSLTA